MPTKRLKLIAPNRQARALSARTRKDPRTRRNRSGAELDRAVHAAIALLLRTLPLFLFRRADKTVLGNLAGQQILVD